MDFTNKYKSIVGFYKDFPKEGILFADIIPFLQSKEVFTELVHDLGTLVTAPTVAAPEARAFLFAAPLLSSPESPVGNIVPFRKKGKTPFNPGDLHEIEIEKEYGSDKLYFRLSDILAGKKNEAEKCIEVCILDDILATGGTALGVAKYLMDTDFGIPGGYRIKVKEFVFLAEIDGLGGSDILEGTAPVRALVHL